MRLFTLLMAIASLAARADPARKFEVETDEQLLEALDKAVGIKSTQCVHRMTGAFAHVILVGATATDKGCQDRGYFADGVYVDSRTNSAPALASAGWKDASKRPALALTWLSQAMATSFKLSHSTAKSGGIVVLEGSVTYPPGMRPERVQVKQRLTFSPSGEVRVEELERTVEPM